MGKDLEPNLKTENNGYLGRRRLWQQFGISINQEDQPVGEEAGHNREYFDPELTNEEIIVLFRTVGLEVEVQDLYDDEGEVIATILIDSDYLKKVAEVNSASKDVRRILWYMLVTWDIDDTLMFTKEGREMRNSQLYKVFGEFGLGAFIEPYKSKMEQYVHDYSTDNIKYKNRVWNTMANYTVFALLISEMQKMSATRVQSLEALATMGQSEIAPGSVERILEELMAYLEEIRNAGGKEDSDDIAREKKYPFFFDNTGKFMISNEFLSLLMKDEALRNALISCIRPVLQPEINKERLRIIHTLATKKQNAYYKIYSQALLSYGARTAQILKALLECHAYKDRFRTKPPFEIMIIARGEREEPDVDNIKKKVFETWNHQRGDPITDHIPIDDRLKTIQNMVNIFGEDTAVAGIRVGTPEENTKSRSGKKRGGKPGYKEVDFKNRSGNNRATPLLNAILLAIEEYIDHSAVLEVPVKLDVAMTINGHTHDREAKCVWRRIPSIKNPLGLPTNQIINIKFKNGDVASVYGSNVILL